MLTSTEASRLAAASGLPEERFAVERRNSNTGHVFRILKLPCPFLELQTGRCGVYENRPLACQLFPLQVDALTGEAALFGTQCGSNLRILPSQTSEGYGMRDFGERVKNWLSELWSETAVRRPTEE